jgi:long-chain acyl-CoA synthetase
VTHVLAVPSQIIALLAESDFDEEHLPELEMICSVGAPLHLRHKKDLIISGSVNVYPRDIEEVAIQHPAVTDVAVFGVPDERWGESPIAAVRLEPGMDASAEDVRSWLNERVEARFQRVREVLILDEFPLSVAGKTLRRVIRDNYLEA